MTIDLIENGNITTPQGFTAGAVSAGIKSDNAYDLGVVLSQSPCKAAGVFTRNRIKSACVLYSQRIAKYRFAQAIVVNSGCANTCTGKQGMIDAKEMGRLTAEKFGIHNNSVFVANTGVIGIKLPMSRISKGINSIGLTKSGGNNFGKAIITTDTFIKEIALSVEDNNGKYIIAGVAKGAGMIHPDMATMLGFITTDALVNDAFLQSALKKAVDDSFNMISVDGDTSTNDMVLILSNGLAGNTYIGNRNGRIFTQALYEVCKFLAKSIVIDGEGATKLIEVTVQGARNKSDARSIARAITSSSLVKTAVHGNDPNWGRIIAAAGRSGGHIVENKADLYLNKQCVFKNGLPQKYNETDLSLIMAKDKVVHIDLVLNSGKGNAIAWGCDLSREYVTINSAYTT
jgi:glutamate N-acetyltransferase/amino-acid N-acetyltransferase